MKENTFTANFSYIHLYIHVFQTSTFHCLSLQIKPLSPKSYWNITQTTVAQTLYTLTWTMCAIKSKQPTRPSTVAAQMSTTTQVAPIMRNPTQAAPEVSPSQAAQNIRMRKHPHLMELEPDLTGQCQIRKDYWCPLKRIRKARVCKKTKTVCGRLLPTTWV